MIPTMPRRGKAAVSPAEMWGAAGRLVHRKVEDAVVGDAVQTPEAVLNNVVEQLAADRAAMLHLQQAIEAVARVVNTHDEGMAVLDGRIEEQTRMRLDDHRLRMGTVTHIRTGVEDLSRSQIQLAEHVDVQDKPAYLEIEKKLQTIKDTVSETVPLLIEAELTSIKGAMGSIHATETEMKDYIVEL